MNEIAKQFGAAIRYGRVDWESADAFHAKMQESPQEHLPHLVFADYLEENGDPGAAEIIRRAADDKGRTYTPPGSQSVFNRPIKVTLFNGTDREGNVTDHVFISLHHLLTSPYPHTDKRRGTERIIRHSIVTAPEDARRLLDAMPEDDSVWVAKRDLDKGRIA